jgi:valyl-tRNA synthetase
MNDLERFHPTTVMETGYDLIFFWIARMILMTMYALGEIPFRTVYLHGLVLDKYGEKMSKSKPETCINPVDVCEKYGTDAVRLSLVIGTSPGNDFRVYEEKIAGFRNFTNKLWNIGRYVIANSKFKIQNSKLQVKTQSLTLAERWILSRLNTLIGEVTEHLEKFEFSQAGEKLRAFTWDEFADWYLEINKIQPNPEFLIFNFKFLISLWHPFMPYVTEELYSRIISELGADKSELLMVAEWPRPVKQWTDRKAEKDFEVIKNIITALRAMRADYKIEPSKKISVIIYGGLKTKLLKEQIEIIKFLARAEEVKIEKSGRRPSQSAGGVVSGVEIYLPLAGLIDIEKERTRLQKELTEVEKYLTVLEKKLANKDFLAHAPAEIINNEKEKLKLQKEKVKKIKEQMRWLK